MNKFGDFTDKQGGVNNSNHWLLGDPAFHATHRDTVNFVPKLYFFIGKMIITYKAAFEFENVGEDKSFFLEVEVSGLLKERGWGAAQQGLVGVGENVARHGVGVYGFGSRDGAPFGSMEHW